MTQRSSAARLVVVLALVTLAVATAHAGQGVIGQPPATKPDIIESVLVKVNGDIITKTDLESRQSGVLRTQKINIQAMSNADLEKLLAELTPQIIVDSVDELLLLQRGKELGYKLSDEKFKQVLENIKKENKIETEEQFQAALKTEGMTLSDLRTRLEKSMVVQQVQGTEVMGRISVSEAEGKAYYEAHKDEFTTPASMMLREILIAVPASKLGFNVAQDEAAKAKADALLARLKAGDSFEKAVADVSEAPSKANGGLIGPISLADVVPALRQILESLKTGQFTEVVRTQAGYQIYKVDTLTPARVQSWEEAREEIGNRIGNSKQAAEFLRYMQKLRAQAVIDWKNAALKKLYDQRVAIELTAK
jgi:peptidyl-prolyl cis-trans isomerase SurA